MAREIRDWHPHLAKIERRDYSDSPYFHVSFVGQPLESRKTKFCNLDIMFNPLFGNMMFIDGEIQICQADYDEYHAAMWNAADVPWHPRVLVVGDGDGGFTYYASSVKSMDIVERDIDVIRAGEKYFGARWDLVNLHQKSVDDFEPTGGGKYDIAFLAIDDGFSLAPGLDERLDRIASWLRPGGVLVAQTGTDLDPKHQQIATRYRSWTWHRRLRWKTESAYVRCYFSHVNFFVIQKD